MGNIQGIPKADECICPVTIDASWTRFEITTLPTVASKWSANREALYQQLKDINRTFLLSSKTFTESTLSNAKSDKSDFAFEENYEAEDMELLKLSNSWLSDSWKGTFTTLNTQLKTQITKRKFLDPAENCTCDTNVYDPWQKHRAISGITSLVVSAIIIIANLFVLGSIIWSLHHHFKRRSTSRLNRSYIFMFNLALADLSVGLADVVSFLINLTQGNHVEYSSCLLEICFIITPCCASIFTMTIVGLDRYLAVMHPFKYKSIMSLKKTFFIVGTIWILSFLIGFAPLMGWGVESKEYNAAGKICSYLFVVKPSYVMFTLFGGFLPQLALIVYLYVKIFKVSKKHNTEIAQLQTSYTNLPRTRDNSYSVFPSEHLALPTYSHSCPVTPVMSRIEIKVEHSQDSHDKPLTPGQKRPYRTVSFGPASFNQDSSFDSNSPIGIEIPVKPHDDNVFERNVDLPGTVHSHIPLPKVETNNDPVITRRTRKLSRRSKSFNKLKRTMSYAGSIAKNSIASQISSRFGTLKKDILKKNIKALRTIALVIGFFFFMWTPFLLVSVVQMICDTSCHLQNLAGTYLLLLGITNSAINPIVYTYTNRELKKLMGGFCCKQKKPKIITDHVPLASETLPDASALHSTDFLLVPNGLARPNGIRTRDSLASNGSTLFANKPRSARSSFASAQEQAVKTNLAPAKRESITSRRSSAVHNPEFKSHASLPPCGRKRSVVKLKGNVIKTSIAASTESL